MDGETLVFLELSITFLLCLGFGFQQLWSLRKLKLQDELKKQALLKDNGHPEQA